MRWFWRPILKIASSVMGPLMAMVASFGLGFVSSAKSKLCGEFKPYLISKRAPDPVTWRHSRVNSLAFWFFKGLFCIILQIFPLSFTQQFVLRCQNQSKNLTSAHFVFYTSPSKDSEVETNQRGNMPEYLHEAKIQRSLKAYWS